MNPQTLIGWALAVAAIAIGWVQWGWPGVVLAVTLIVFWLLLQFSRTLRLLRSAGQSPVGHVASAAMLNAKLQRGMRLPHVIVLTRSLGKKLSDEPELWVWTDPGGDSVQLELRDARLERWALQRAQPVDAPTADA